MDHKVRVSCSRHEIPCSLLGSQELAKHRDVRSTSAGSLREVLAGLINPLPDKRNINVGLSCFGEQHDNDDRDCVRYRAGTVAGLLH